MQTTARRGRPGLGARLAHHLEGSGFAKARLEVILQNLRDEITAVEAAEKLGLSESRYHTLRSEALQHALAGLEPKRKGPKGSERDPLVEELESRLAETEGALEALQLKLEMAESMEDVEQLEAERLAAFEEEQKKTRQRQLKARRKKEKKKRRRR